MGIAERREREKEMVRQRIVEAARDIVSEQGLDALSMRAIAELIEYSPATIYLHFRDKDELLRTIVQEGFSRLRTALQREIDAAGSEASAVDRYRATGRGYVRFGLEHTAYLQVMFDLPKVAQMGCRPEPVDGEVAETADQCFEFVVQLVREAIEEGSFREADAYRRALVGWGAVHGLVSLYLSGCLGESVTTQEELEALVEEAMQSMGEGWEVPQNVRTRVAAH